MGFGLFPSTDHLDLGLGHCSAIWQLSLLQWWRALVPTDLAPRWHIQALIASKRSLALRAQAVGLRHVGGCDAPSSVRRATTTPPPRTRLPSITASTPGGEMTSPRSLSPPAPRPSNLWSWLCTMDRSRSPCAAGCMCGVRTDPGLSRPSPVSPTCNVPRTLFSTDVLGAKPGRCRPSPAPPDTPPEPAGSHGCHPVSPLQLFEALWNLGPSGSFLPC